MLLFLIINQCLLYLSTFWFTSWLEDWFTDWLRVRLADWLAFRLAGWQAVRLTDWCAVRLAGWLRLAGRLADWLAGWLAWWLAGWLAGWLTSWLAGCFAGICSTQHGMGGVKWNSLLAVILCTATPTRLKENRYIDIYLNSPAWMRIHKRDNTFCNSSF